MWSLVRIGERERERGREREGEREVKELLKNEVRISQDLTFKKSLFTIFD